MFYLMMQKKMCWQKNVLRMMKKGDEKQAFLYAVNILWIKLLW